MQVLVSGQPDMPTPEQWDHSITQDPTGHLLQTWAWGELKGAFGWIPMRVVVMCDGAIVAGAQVLYRRAGPVTAGYIPKGPFYCVQDKPTCDTLWRAIHALSRRMRAISLKVEPDIPDTEAACHRELTARGLRPSSEMVQPRRTIIVDIEPEAEEILARMKPKWRYNIRLSERKGVQVRQAGPSDLPAFYELMRMTGDRDEFGIHSLPYYTRALALFAPERAALFLACYEGVPLAGLMAFAFNGQAWYMYGASSNAHRERMPNHQLQWHAMQWAKERGCTRYDLWGIADEEEDPATAALGGVQRFKEGFGGQVVRYVGAYDYVYSTPLDWLMRKYWALRRARRS
ncbi:MAG: lipid II:glycine glycyltransferase FemX [Anaerolineae bacterium]